MSIGSGDCECVADRRQHRRQASLVVQHRRSDDCADPSTPHRYRFASSQLSVTSCLTCFAMRDVCFVSCTKSATPSRSHSLPSRLPTPTPICGPFRRLCASSLGNQRCLASPSTCFSLWLTAACVCFACVCLCNRSNYYVKVTFSAYPSISAQSADFAVDGCTFAPCLNSGVCSASGATCTCPTGVTGASCQTDPCAAVTCQNSGVCVNTQSGTASCQCQSGFSGNYCEVSSSTCSMTCANGGMIANGCTSCTCPASKFWTGSTCATCSLPCANGAAAAADCESCLCGPGYGGTLCNQVMLCLQLRLTISYSTYTANPTAFTTSFKNDVAVSTSVL